MSPYSFLEVFLHQSPALVKKSWTSPATADVEISLPPTYMPPESTQVVDATFYYVIGGMTLMAAAFGNLIILNFVRLRQSPNPIWLKNDNGVKSVTSP